MPDVLQIVTDTLRTMMGATAADPYIKAIEKAVAESRILTTDEAIAAIGAIISSSGDGTWESALRIVRYLREQADKLDDEVQDDMSSRHE